MQHTTNGTPTATHEDRIADLEGRNADLEKRNDDLTERVRRLETALVTIGGAASVIAQPRA